MQPVCCDEEILDAINRYFSLKTKYQTKLDKQKQKLISDSTLSKKERRQKYFKMPKLCINCNKEGGTLFSEKNRTYIAQCQAKPRCNLDVEIRMPKFEMREKAIKDYETDNEIFKSTVIMTKLSYIFGYLSEEQAVTEFNKLKDELKEIDDTLIYLTGKMLMLLNNPTKKINIEENNVKLQDLIRELKTLKKMYEEENAPEVLTEMVELQIKKIFPLVETTRLLKYSYNVIEFNEDDNTYHLIQEVAMPEQMEIKFDDQEATIIKNFDDETTEKKIEVLPETKIIKESEQVKIVEEKIPRAPSPPFDKTKLAIAEKRLIMLEKECETNMYLQGECADARRLVQAIKEILEREKYRDETPAPKLLIKNPKVLKP
jgi:hypothetical protein